jgi:hypothetical protein
LISIGSTLYDAEAWSIEEEIRDPWGQNIRSECEEGDMPPIPMRPGSRDFEVIVADLLPRYIALRKSLGLRDPLLTYWLANEAFAGVNLALYGSAVEGLKKGWFASTKTKSKGVHMLEDEFVRVAGQSLQQLVNRLAAAGAPKAVANKITGAFRMGANEQLVAFFAEVDLPVGDHERAAIAARNAPVHGGLVAGADLKKLVRHANTYRCLFERLFLKLLGYTGDYIDRSALTHPATPLQQPCRGHVTGD